MAVLGLRTIGCYISKGNHQITSDESHSTRVILSLLRVFLFSNMDLDHRTGQTDTMYYAGMCEAVRSDEGEHQGEKIRVALNSREWRHVGRRAAERGEPVADDVACAPTAGLQPRN